MTVVEIVAALHAGRPAVPGGRPLPSPDGPYAQVPIGDPDEDEGGYGDDDDEEDDEDEGEDNDDDDERWEVALRAP